MFGSDSRATRASLSGSCAAGHWAPTISSSTGPIESRSPGQSLASVKGRPLSRVSGDQQRAIVAAGPRRIRQCSGATPAARSRSVQSCPDPMRTLGRPQPHGLTVARPPADLQNQFGSGFETTNRLPRKQTSCQPSSGPGSGFSRALSPIQLLAYAPGQVKSLSLAGSGILPLR